MKNTLLGLSVGLAILAGTWGAGNTTTDTTAKTTGCYEDQIGLWTVDGFTCFDIDDYFMEQEYNWIIETLYKGK